MFASATRNAIATAQSAITTVEDPIDGRFGIHDSNHFEVKLDYQIQSDVPLNRYSVESYFFIPKSLGINSNTYSREQFYSDMQAYIRFRSPSLPLETLFNVQHELSPLRSIWEYLPKVKLADATKLPLLINEMKLFGCAMRANVRDQVDRTCHTIERLKGRTEAHLVLVRDVRDSLLRFVGELQRTVEMFRQLRIEIQDPHVPETARVTYAYIDEYISLVIEFNMTKLVETIDLLEDVRPRFEDARRSVKELLLNERVHRRGSGYPSVVSEQNADERFVHHQGLLKKFAMSVLWLEIARERDGQRLQQILGGIAAGVAMLFAVIATILHSNWFAINTWGFAIAVVVTYIFKDRMKELLKGYFSAKASRWLADYSVSVHDPLTHHDIGHCRESVSFVPMTKIPQEILELRHIDAPNVIERTAKPEVVLRYQKEVLLDSKAVVDRLHQPRCDINDIIRFDISQFLVRTDDAVSMVPIFNETEDRVEMRRMPKVYHLNIVMVLKAEQGGARTMKRMRVVFDKQGIRRIEQVV